MESTIRLYESTSIACNYSKYRPTYPKELTEKICSFTSNTGRKDSTMAVDLACGPGQSTFQLCDFFDRTVGIDISQAQIKYAQERAKTLRVNDIQFMQCPASELPFEDASVDLISCGMAWHWLDPSAVFPEIDRVLKQNGVVAVFGYGIPRICHNLCEKHHIYYNNNNLFWHETQYGNMKTVLDNLYADVKLPYPLMERYDCVVKSTTTLEGLRGFISSLDEYESYCKLHPGSTALEDMLKTMRRILLEEKGMPTEITDITPFSNVSIDIEIPYYLLLTSN